MDQFFPANGYRLRRPFWTAEQKRAFDRSCDLDKFALWHEPRCGKSDVVANSACRWHSLPSHPLHVRGVLIVVWPQGGQIGWVNEIFPATATVPWAGLYWDSSRAGTKDWRIRFDHLLRTTGLAVLAVNGEALISDKCREHIGMFASHRKPILAVGDEISAIANADTRRNRVMQSISNLPFVVARRVLDGTPTDRKGPLDFFTEVGFLDFGILGYPNETEYRAHYAEMRVHGRAPFWREVNRLTKVAKERGYKDPKGWAERGAQGAFVDDEGKRRKLVAGRDYWTDVARGDDNMPVFRNMDELHRRLDPWSDRCTFRQAFPNSNAQVFAKRFFELTTEQRRVYDQVEEEHRATLKDGTEISVNHHLTRVLRLQQIASNYYPDQKSLVLHEPCGGLGCEECGDSGVVELELPLRTIDDANPRMDALAQELRDGKPTIVWTRFRPDAEACYGLAKGLGLDPVRYDGSVSAKAKLENRTAFQDGRAGCIVGNWASMSRAIPLHKAERHVAYGNQWSFRTRQQGEQRSEHGSKSAATQFVDIVGVDTVDDRQILPALRQGYDVSVFVLRDEKREWL